MPTNPWPLIRRLFREPPGDPVPDTELLRRFVESRDQAAFELLVWRHGGMVFGVCRRVLRDGHAAEDAFQATFLVLARKASSIRTTESVAGWLHRVARRVALRAAKQHATRRQRETVLVAEPLARAGAEPDAELRALLDAEIDRLPERFRLPVVLCYLDGRTTEDAARLLGVPRGTVLSRLATARQRLAARLTRRGVTLPAGGLFGVGWAASERVSAEQVGECVSAAIAFVAGGAGAGVAFQLANGVIQMGTRKVIAAWATALVVAAGLTTGVGVTAGGPKLAAESQPPAAPKQVAAAPPTTPKEDARQTSQEEERIKRLNDVVKRLTESIANIHAQLAELPNPVVLKALSDVYTQTELTAFQAQLDVQALERRVADIKNEKGRGPATREQLASAAESLKTKKNLLSDLDARRAELRTRIEKMTRQSAEAESLKAKLQMGRELLQRCGREILNLELQQRTGVAPPAASADADKLDRILRELAGLRADVRRLQEQKK